MATYAIGDIQGCYAPLQEILRVVKFDAEQDTLWFTGDLVNRGPDSLQVLRFIKSLGSKHKIVLGNHDLHFLAMAFGIRKEKYPHTLAELLHAEDRQELVDWLRRCPLLHYDEAQAYLLVHAGLAPHWDIAKAQTLAQEVENVLSGDAPQAYLSAMYGNQRDLWRDDLTGMVRLRCITNYLTRMRYCYPDLSLDLKSKGIVDNAERIPWYALPSQIPQQVRVIFGHWAALDGVTNTENRFALDTGCGGWGRNCLTAMRLEDQALFSVPCEEDLRGK